MLIVLILLIIGVHVMAVVMEEDVFMSDMILAAKEFAPIWEGALLHKNKVISNVRALGRSRLQKQM